MSKPQLLTPLTIRDVTLKSRIVVSPMATYSAVDGLANDWHLGHYARLALGQPASVMVEATAVTDQGRITNGDVGLWSSAHIPPLRRITELMRSVGVIPSIQLAHAGRKGAMQRPWHGNGALTPADIARGDKAWDIVGPTADPIDKGYITPHALTPDDMRTLARQWGEAAARAVEAGFGIVEIHNAHGYLVHQFLSPISNTRNDAYGGDLAGRTRFPLMIAEAVRAAVPKGMPVFLRVSAVDGIDGGWSMDDTVAYARLLKERGIDLVDCSSGGLKGPATVARIKRTWGFQVPFAEQVRREAGVMSMAVGLILEPQHADDIVAKGQADLVAIGREALFNPSWPQMAEIALGRKPSEAMDDWPVQYGWWLKHRETSLEQVRRDFGERWQA
jgi:2,4-dienoyl-CoA reductase-like NADH-dependent reductase (Old Yellow Enzyme family)